MLGEDRKDYQCSKCGGDLRDETHCTKCHNCGGCGFTLEQDNVCTICNGDGKHHPEKYTCNDCEDKKTCPYAFDPYNTSGDCLDLK